MDLPSESKPFGVLQMDAWPILGVNYLPVWLKRLQYLIVKFRSKHYLIQKSRDLKSIYTPGKLFAIYGFTAEKRTVSNSKAVVAVI